MRSEVKDRVELDKRLKASGLDAKLFSSDEARDKAKWVLKKMRLGEDRKTIKLSEIR